MTSPIGVEAERTRLARLRSYSIRTILLLTAVLVGALGMRAWMSRSAPDLQPWHVMIPAELDTPSLESADWTRYLEVEGEVFADVAREMREEIDAQDRTRLNRYHSESRVAPDRFATNWNRSQVLQPEAEPSGIAVLLHGMTDSPYSMRHLAEIYRQRGFIAVAVRLPGHGTVPGALTRIDWQQWTAATHLAMREAGRLARGALPIHLVGYSNGGALAVKYALDSLENPALPRAARIVLLSPMIGVNRNARFAGIAGWPAILPAFARTAWLDILPEFNPFKYNSFPVNAARQSYLLTNSLQTQLVRLKDAGQLEALPPILTFLSLVDATVIASDVVTALYAHLPANGSELVLFDINRIVEIEPFLRRGVLTDPGTMLNPPPRKYSVTVLTNAGPQSEAVVARNTLAGAIEEAVQTLDLRYPHEVFSLSHIALPFPVSDGLYGLDPDATEDFGVRLGALGMRGERGVLASGLDITTVRLSSNPFFPYVAARIDAGIGH